MPANTYTLIEKIVVGAAGASSITFTSIPQTYTDLVIKWSGRDNQPGATANDCTINFNGSATSFSGRRLYGNGTSALSDTVAPYAGSDTGAGATTSTFSNNEIYIPNYTGSTNKSFSLDSVTERSGTEAYQLLYAGLWSNTAAITSISIVAPASYPFQQYSTFYLYGIAKEGVSPSPSSAPYATGGDSIVFDGTYWIHTFTSSGTFTPKKALTCDYLVVAGGGGGGGNPGLGYGGAGGGGAGGLRSTVTATGGGGSLESVLSLAANTGYTVTVGAGGAAGAGNNNGSAGSNSVFSSITSTGGGFGSTQGTNGSTAGTGGSGGGGGYTRLGGAGTANQGYAGGSGDNGLSGANGAGGGGAGAAGQGRQANNGGNGGNGVATSISGSSVTYGGGGSGGGYYTTPNPGTAGTGGGGTGGVDGGAAATAGTANTGGGGGGSGGTQNGGQGTSSGGAGGSGIVIVRYAA